MIIKNELHNKIISLKGGVNKLKVKSVLEKNNLIQEIQALKPDGTLLEAYYWFYHDLKDYPRKCSVCFKNLTKFKNFNVGYSNSKTCSIKCSTSNPERNIKSKKTNLLKYGSEHPMNNALVVKKIKDTNLERYGVSSTLQIESAKKGMFEKYGVNNISQSEYWKIKTKETFKNKFRGYSFLNGSELNEKAVSTLKEELDIEGDYSFHQLSSWKRDSKSLSTRARSFNYEILESDYSKNTIVLKHECGEVKETFISDRSIFRCLTCRPLKFSMFECEVFDFLSKELNITDIIRNDRSKIYPLELDFYIPSLNLGIECNGDYWHSYPSAETSEQKKKHLTKLLTCEDAEIRLIQITGSEWENKNIQVKSILRAAAKKSIVLEARKLKILEIDSKVGNAFLNVNHLQGGTAASIFIALMNNLNEPVMVLSAGKNRFNKNEYELIRISSKLNHSIIGGLERLIKALKNKIKNEHITKIVSYVDRRYFTGHSLKRSGWIFEKTSSPGYCYLMPDGTRLSRYQAQKGKLQRLLKEHFNPNLSESENMFFNNCRRLWDCGTLKFCYNF